MRVIFLGTPETAVVTLEALLRADHDVRLVVTRPDRPLRRSREPVPPPVKRAAVERGIPVHQPKRVRNAAFLETLSSHEPDVLVVVAYGRILPRPVLDLAPYRAINLHFSLLPKYRGAAPVQWALARQEQTTGVTSMLMNEQLDEGDLLLQRSVPIESGEHAPSLQRRLAQLGAQLTVETLAGLAAGALEPRAQDPSAATFAPLLAASDGRVDPVLRAGEIAGRVRGFDPWPGVWVARSGRRMRIVQARELTASAESSPPGRVMELTPEGLVVACGEGTRLVLERVQPEGKRVMDARDAVNGRQLVPGDRLERLGEPS